MFSATPSLKPHKASLKASLRANTGVLSSKQCRHPISCLYHHYHAFGLNVATIISHLNYCNSLLTGLLCSTPYSGFSVQKPSIVLKCKLDKLSLLLKVLLVKGSPYNGREAQQCWPCHFFEPISPTFLCFLRSSQTGSCSSRAHTRHTPMSALLHCLFLLSFKNIIVFILILAVLGLHWCTGFPQLRQAVGTLLL